MSSSIVSALPCAQRLLRLVLLPLVAVFTLSGAADKAAAAEQSRIGPKRFDAESLVIEHVIGAISIEVAEDPKIEVTLEGRTSLLEDIQLRKEGNRLVIARKQRWLDFPERQLYEWRDVYPRVTVRAPVGTALTLDSVVGIANVGDLQAPLKMEVSLLEAEIGQMTEASLALLGRGDIAIGPVAGALSVDMSGSSDLKVTAAKTVKIQKSGSGDISLGTVSAGFNYEGTGSGDTQIETIEGPVEVLINGSGSVRIASGEADPLRLRINGSGDFRFGGTAIDPDVTIKGSGTIRIQSHKGTLRLRSFSGAVNVTDSGGLSIAQ